MTVLILAGFAGVVLAAFAVDRVAKALVRARRRRMMSARLAAATVRGEEQQQQRKESVQASKALTAFIPAIQQPPLTIPGVPPRASKRPKNRNEITGPQATHPGRKPARASEHHADRAKRG